MSQSLPFFTNQNSVSPQASRLTDPSRGPCATPFGSDNAGRDPCNGGLQRALAKWLLMAHDHSEEDDLPVLQALMRYRLGVAVVAGIQAGIIRCNRGRITVLNRARWKRQPKGHRCGHTRADQGRSADSGIAEAKGRRVPVPCCLIRADRYRIPRSNIQEVACAAANFQRFHARRRGT
jgi:hypothetical protein